MEGDVGRKDCGLRQGGTKCAEPHTTSDNTLAATVLSNPIIIEKILSCLPVKVINKCARVCKGWAQEASKVKRSRQGMAWNYFRCGEDGADSLAYAIETFIENLAFEPQFALVFCSSNLHDETIPCRKSNRVRGMSHLRPIKRERKEGVEVSSFLQRLLPSSCRFTAVTADGIVGTSSDMRITEEMEGERTLSVILFSQMSGGIHIEPFYYDSDEGNQLAAHWTDRQDRVEPKLDPQKKKVRSLVFLCDEAFCPQEVGFSLYRMYQCPMIAGGFVDDVVCPPSWKEDNTRDSPYLCCIAFCGEQLCVASVVIKDDICTPENVDAIIKKLKDNALPEKKSIGFMFACVGRGENHYREKNVESKIFKKYFPNTPLLGFFGNGEVGFQYPHVTPADLTDTGPTNGTTNHRFVEHQSSYLASHPPKMYHAYTTIMCLVSFP